MFSQPSAGTRDLTIEFAASILFSGTGVAGTPYLVPTADRIEARLQRSGAPEDTATVVTRELTLAPGSDHLLTTVLEFPEIPTNVEHIVTVRIFSSTDPDQRTLHSGTAVVPPVTRGEHNVSVSVTLNPDVVVQTLEPGFIGENLTLPADGFALYRLDVPPGLTHELVVNVFTDPEDLNAEILTSSFRRSGIEITVDAAGAFLATLPVSAVPYFLALYNSSGTAPVDYSLELTSLFAIGDIGPAGGYIFYENPDYLTDGWRFMEVAPQDYGGPGTTRPWWVDPALLAIDNTLAEIGSGPDNTQFIIDAIDPPGSTDDTAAEAADFYSLGGFDDWFLPSLNELLQVYNNLAAEGLGDFGTGAYWSSTEDDIDNARTVLFLSGNPSVASKFTSYTLRPVRRF